MDPSKYSVAELSNKVAWYCVVPILKTCAVGNEIN